MDDSVIIGLFFARSERAIAELAAKYGHTCMRISYGILRNHEDSEECVNDTYLKVWDTVPPKKPDPLMAYVLRIVKNLSINRYTYNKAQKRNGALDVCYEELKECIPDRDSQNITGDNELEEVIDRFLNSLSEENHAIFVRRYWSAESVKDIADDLELPENTVAVRIHRIRRQFKKFLEKEGVAL